MSVGAKGGEYARFSPNADNDDDRYVFMRQRECKWVGTKFLKTIRGQGIAPLCVFRCRAKRIAGTNDDAETAS